MTEWVLNLNAGYVLYLGRIMTCVIFEHSGEQSDRSFHNIAAFERVCSLRYHDRE